MLFDTPGVAPPPPQLTPSATQPNSSSKKRQRQVGDPAHHDTSQQPINLEKLMKQMQKIEHKNSGWSPATSAPQGAAVAKDKRSTGAAEDEPSSKRTKKNKNKNKNKAGGVADVTSPQVNTQGPIERGKAPHLQSSATEPTASTPKPHTPQWQPAKKEKKDKKTKKSKQQEQEAEQEEEEAFEEHALSSATPSTGIQAAFAASSSTNTGPKSQVRHSAPNQAEEFESGPAVPQTAMQKALRAKLAGGKFRMLNEALYTTTGEEAWKLMKEDGAFDDYHAGFRGQAAHWPTQPISLLTASLSQLGAGKLVADFGCGDAALARALVPQGVNVISFDLVSKDGWVVEAECSSVPLPGGAAGGGEIVDVVVCCLSLMGTDWVDVVREARRVLKTGGQLRIAEVTSRFTDVNGFVNLIEGVGFKLLHKDDSNTHFIMFDFEKTGGVVEGDRKRRMERTLKGPGLLKPCIYKKR